MVHAARHAFTRPGDTTAQDFARSLGAVSVTLFKEVDGLMTADPKSVPEARMSWVKTPPS